MSSHLLTVAVGLLGAVSITGIVVGTSSDLRPLAPLDVPGALQLPLFIVLGMLLGFALRDLTSSAIAFGITCLLGSELYAALLAVPGFSMKLYSAIRFNKGMTDSLYVTLVGGVFVIAGLGIAFAVNAYVRHVYE